MYWLVVFCIIVLNILPLDSYMSNLHACSCLPLLNAWFEHCWMQDTCIACMHARTHARTRLLLMSMHWHRQAIFESKGDVVFLCWMQDSNPGSLEPNLQQTECPLTNRLSHWGSNWKLELNSPSLWSASIQSTCLHCRLAFAPGSGDIKFHQPYVDDSDVPHCVYNGLQTMFMSFIGYRQMWVHP